MARARLWMELYFSPRRNPGIADHFPGRAPAGIAEVVDFQGPPSGSRSDCRAGGGQHQPQNSNRDNLSSVNVKPDAARTADRTSLETISRTHVDCMDALGERLLHRQRSE